MATIENIYTGDGATVLFSFTFPYLDESHIKVSVNGVDTTAYTLANATTVQMNSAPANGATVRIYRETNIDNLSATFYPGSAIRASDLNNNFTQNLYIDQEAVSYSIRTDGNKAMQADLDLGGFNIVNLADPTASDEAATKGYVDGVFASEVPVFYRRWSKTAAGGETSLSGNDDAGISLSYVPGSEKVFINGALQVRGVDYTAATGTAITGIPALTLGDIVEVHSSSSYTTTTIPDGSVTNAKVDAAAAIQSTKLSFTQAGSGAVARTVQSKLRDVVSVKDFGAVGDGVTDDTAAIQSALSAYNHVFFPQGNYRIATNTTLAAGKTLEILNGASFVVDSGRTLTIYSDLIASPSSQLFDGLGTTVGLGEVYPEWWGAVGDGVTDDQPAFAKAVASIQGSFASPTAGVVKLQAKTYLLGSTWIIPQNANYPISVIGAGTLIGQTRLLAPASFSGALVSVEGTTGGGEIVDFQLKGFAIIATTAGFGVGLQIGASSGNSLISGLQESLVEDIHISNFKFGMIVRRTRLINFRRLSIWNDGIDGSVIGNANICLKIENTGSTGGTFTGDMTFESCQFVNNKQTYSDVVVIESSNVNGTSFIAGIRFSKCILYKGGDRSLKIVTANNCEIGDLWITDCQFDDTTGIQLKTFSANDVITDVHISNCYFTATPFNAVLIDAGASPGRINCIGINHCSCAGSGITVECSNATNIIVTGNRFSGCTAPTGAPFVFFNCNEVVCCDNSAGRFGPLPTPGAFQHLVYLLGTGNYYVVTGNNSAGLATGALVQNTTGAANTAIANNI
jgi:hypothetical protein